MDVKKQSAIYLSVSYLFMLFIYANGFLVSSPPPIKNVV